MGTLVVGFDERLRSMRSSVVSCLEHIFMSIHNNYQNILNIYYMDCCNTCPFQDYQKRGEYPHKEMVQSSQL